MRKERFIEALHGAKWRDYGDSQRTEIERLWRRLFPVVAELEDELAEAHEDAAEREKTARREALEKASGLVRRLLEETRLGSNTIDACANKVIALMEEEEGG